MIAEIYREGKAGVAQDGHKAVEYLTKIAGRKAWLSVSFVNEAFYELGTIYEEGCGSVLPDIQKAIAYYQKSAEQGYNSAKMKLEELVGSKDS